MKMSYREDYLCSVEFGSLFWETGTVSKVHEEFTATNKAHDKKDFLFCLENVVHTNEERMIGLKKDILFKFCAFNLIIINYNVFPQRFHCINLSSHLFLYQKYLPKTSSPDNFLYLKIMKCDFLISSPCIQSLRCAPSFVSKFIRRLGIS